MPAGSHGRKYGRKILLNKAYREKGRKTRADKLTLKQKKFVREYLLHGNATEAARVAYDGKEKNKTRVGYATLHMPKIQNAINRALKAAKLDEDFAMHALRDIIDAGSKNLAEAKPGNALKGIEMFLKIKGILGEKGRSDDGDDPEKIANQMTTKQLQEELRKIDEQQKKLFEIMKGGAEEGEVVNEN